MFAKITVSNPKWKRQFNELVMEKKDDPMRFFAGVDKFVGVLESLGVYLPLEDVNLKTVEVLTADYEFEQRISLSHYCLYLGTSDVIFVQFRTKITSPVPR